MFAAAAQLFTRPWLAVDHVSRLAAMAIISAPSWQPLDRAGSESSNRLHALRNACLHAGYRVARKSAAATTSSASITAGPMRSTAG